MLLIICSKVDLYIIMKTTQFYVNESSRQQLMLIMKKTGVTLLRETQGSLKVFFAQPQPPWLDVLLRRPNKFLSMSLLMGQTDEKLNFNGWIYILKGETYGVLGKCLMYKIYMAKYSNTDISFCLLSAWFVVCNHATVKLKR